jgi:hypothetical protein
VPWCKFFVPKIAALRVSPDDPDFNDSVAYAKCIKGHVLKNADDWILCENLPAPDARCWQEGGDTIFSLRLRQNAGTREETSPSDSADATTAQRASS